MNKAVSITAFLLVTAGVLWWCAKMGKRRIYLLFPVFLLVGFIRMEIEDTGIANRKSWNLEGSFLEAEGELTAMRQKQDTLSLTLKDVTIKKKDKEFILPRILVYVYQNKYVGQKVRPGDRILVSGELKTFDGPRNPGEFDSKRYYYSQKLEFCMMADSVNITERKAWNLRAYLYRFRGYCLKLLEQITEPEDTGIFKAALLGEKDSMDAEIKSLYQQNGIAHLLAISGLHVSIIGMGMYGILRKSGLGYGQAGIICLVLLLCYGIISGESSSVLRAVIMILCQCIANYLGRTYDLVSAACFAALLLLWDSPYQLFEGGVQLSFGAVLAIGIPGRFLVSVFQPKNYFLNTILINLSIQFVTYPIILYHFYQFPIYGILLNLLVVPLMAYVIYSGIAGLVLGSFSLAAGIAAIGSGHYILAWYLWLCRLFSHFPGSNVILGRPDLKQIGFYAVIGCIGFIVIKQVQSSLKKLCILFVLTFCCFFSLMPSPIKGLEVTFLDVGQGDGIVVRTADCSILVDGGSSSEKKLGAFRLEPYLKSRGIQTIDYAIVSHGDMDHISGLLYLLEEETGIVIRNLLLPCLGKRDAGYQELVEAAKKHGSKVQYMAQDDSLKMGSLIFDCLYPGWKDTAADKNEQSAMYRVSYGKFSMLLTGDMSKEGEEQMMENHSVSSIQVLKAGHHGSKTSTGQTLIDRAAFQWAVLSYGKDNSYGHPHKEVLDRLEAAEVKLWETARSGAITLKTDGNNIYWDTYLQPDTGLSR